ncbi:poly(A)-specific ribonuclease PNLDC1-like isoform X2 [Physella acuta]|nr:poly(A)-specific ribonuclease PNLDC1-like isoform X2 [Physella acuta]
MIEVNRDNFDIVYPKVEYAIKVADFISIDAEFTGLHFDERSKPSLFDSSTERYAKLKRSIQKYTLSQIGLTTFTRNITNNQYLSQTFNFYLCPIPFGSNDQRFCLQASSLQFLCKHLFNFNKWFYEGIPYLNNVQEQVVWEELDGGLLFGGINSTIDEKEIQSFCSKVASWLPNSKIGESLTLTKCEDSQEYIYHSDLRMRFSQIWTYKNQFDQIVVEHVDSIKRHLLEKQSHESDRQFKRKQVLQLLGFTRIFRLLQKSHKPIVGHNLLMDLMFMYDKFYNPLPESYRDFKEGINKLFPVIFDTKHMNYCLKKQLESLEIYNSNSLVELYHNLSSTHFLLATIHQPSILQDEDESGAGDEEKPHHAGYDSYLCGCVFLRLSHFLHYRNIDAMDAAPCIFKDYLQSLKKYKNCINIIRAMVNHIRLDGEEPPCQRPPLIHVESILPGGKLISQQLAAWFSLYGTVDIQTVNTRQALVATSNFLTAQDIIQAFKNHHSIRVTKYRFWDHSSLGQGIFW